MPLGVAIGAVVGLALAAVAVGLWSDTRRRAASAPDAARPVAADRPADSTSDLALGAILGLAVLAVMALQLPSYLALAVSGLAVLTAAVLPPAGLAALIVLLPHQEPEILGAIGVKLPILAALGYGVGIRALAARDVPRPGIGVVAAIGLLGIAFVSAIPAINGLAGERAVAAASRLLPFAAGILLLVIAGWYFRRRDPAPFMVLTLLSVTLASALALLQLVAGDEPIPLIRGLYVEGAAQGLARVTGPFLNPNYFGLFGGLGVVLALGIAVELPQHRRLALLCLPILGLAVLGTLSRGAIAATGVGVLTWLWFRNRQLALLAGAAAVVAGLVVTPLLVGARLDSPTAAAAAEAQAGISSSDQERLESVAAGTQLFLLDPLFGVGFGQYEFVSPRFVGNSFATAAHNQYLKILAEQGIVGMTLYLAGAAALLVAMRRSGSRWRQTAIAMLAVYAVSGLFLEPLTTFQTSGVLWLVLGVVVGRAGRAAAARSASPRGPRRCGSAQAAPRRPAAVCHVRHRGTRHARRAAPRRPALADDMLATLAHRGPDEQRVFQDKHVALGTRRLSIIDLDTGSQPLGNEDGSIQVSPERRDLQLRRAARGSARRGHTLRDSGDTETIVHLYEEYGDRFVEHLRGHVRDRDLGRPPPAVGARPRPAGQEADLLGACATDGSLGLGVEGPAGRPGSAPRPGPRRAGPVPAVPVHPRPGHDPRGRPQADRRRS